MDEFELELKNAFLEEAAQLLVDAEQCFLSLEQSPDDISIIDKIFRLAHNLKGSSKAVGFEEMGAFAHVFESLLLKIKNNEFKATPPLVGLLLKCNDHINMMVESLKADVNATFQSDELIGQIEAAMRGELNDGPAGSAIEDENFVEEIFDVPGADLFPEEQVEPPHGTQLEAQDIPEMLEGVSDPDNPAPPTLEVVAAQSPAATPAPVEERKPVAKAQTQAAADETIRVSLSRLEKLLNFIGEMVILQTVLREQTQSSSMFVRKTMSQLSKVTKEVQDLSMSLRMVPLKQTFQKMQRIVRDTSSALNKKINLTIDGEDTEVDKTVLENINDPLVHIVRNAVDHGIETGEKRLAAGKPEAGHVTLDAYHQSGKLIIEIRDDGGGINPNVIRQKAIEKGLIRESTILSRQETLQLVFAPGFSTKAVVTDVSGRGVGMDVVKTNIEALQGEVFIETEVGKGTIFKISLPLTLAIIEAMVVQSQGIRYIIPLSHVHESVSATEKEIHQSSSLGEILLLRGESLPVYRLSQLLGRKAQASDTSGIALVIRMGEQPFAVMVDDILGQQQVVVKKLGDEVANLKGFTGSAILGDGKPSLILELTELISNQKNTRTEGRRAAV